MVGETFSTSPSPPRQRRDERAADSLSDVAISATIVAGLLDVGPDGLLLVDASGVLLLVNRRIEELFGYTRGELLGRSVEILLPESQRDLHVAHRARYADNPQVRPMSVDLALRGRRRDGSEFPVDVSLSPLVTGDGQWVLAAVRDDRPRQDAEARRRDAAVSNEQGRIAEGLGDTVIRGLFGTGLHLQGLLERHHEEMVIGVQEAIEEIDATIRDVRAAIFELRSDDGRG